MNFHRLIRLGALAVTVMAIGTSTAQADEWYIDPGEEPLGGEEESREFTGEGMVSTTAGGFTTGPGKITIAGEVWDQNGMGHAKVNYLIFHPSSPVNPLPPALDCTATTGAYGDPWTATMTSGAPPIHFENVQVTKHFNAACQALGFPATATASGTLTSEFNNETSCFEFVNAGDMTTGLSSETWNGEICIEGPEGEVFTAK